MVEDVQYMQLGGMASPYADPMPKMQVAEPMGPQQADVQQPMMQQGGVGGLFQDMHRNQMGMMQAQMGGAPLEVYGNYLNTLFK